MFRRRYLVSSNDLSFVPDLLRTHHQDRVWKETTPHFALGQDGNRTSDHCKTFRRGMSLHVTSGPETLGPSPPLSEDGSWTTLSRGHGGRDRREPFPLDPGLFPPLKGFQCGTSTSSGLQVKGTG